MRNKLHTSRVCRPRRTKRYVKWQLGRGRKNVSSKRESFVPVIICRGQASAINANCEHKGWKNSTKPQLCSRYILKRYGVFTIFDASRCTFIIYPHLSRRDSPVCLFFSFPLFGPIKLATVSFSSRKHFPQRKFTKLSSSKETVSPSHVSSQFFKTSLCHFIYLSIRISIVLLQSEILIPKYIVFSIQIY